MTAIETDFGKVFFEDGNYVLEKVYRGLDELMQEEPRIKRRAKKLGFSVKSNKWYIEDNPLYEAEKVFADYEPNKVRFRYKVILSSCTY